MAFRGNKLIGFHDEEQPEPSAHERAFSFRKKRPEYDCRTSLLAILLADLATKGRFLVEEDRLFYMAPKQPFPIPLEKGNRACELLLSEYAITPGEQMYDLVLKELQLAIQSIAEEVRLKHFSSYDETQNILCLSRGDQVIRITSSAISFVKNGSDGVVFSEPGVTLSRPFELSDDSDAAIQCYQRTILESVNFTDDGLGMTKADQKRLYEAYLLSIYFPELMPTKPILTLVGEKGSGKSSSLRRLGRLVLGPDFDVRMLPDNPEEFDVAVTNDSFTVFDNVDTHIRWLEDKLAGCATGTTIVRRKLYTTNQQEVFAVKARIALTARAPRFRRDDVCERLVVLRVNRFSKFIPEHNMDLEFEHNYSLAFSGLLYVLQSALQALEDTKGYPFESEVRLADFASFTMRIGQGRAEEKETTAAISSLINEQQAFSFEENVLFGFLREWVEETGGTTEPATSGVLFAALREYSRRQQQDFNKIASSSVSLGKQLVGLINLANCPLSISFESMSGRRKAWTIRERQEC
jgi:hypothetical protein